MKLSVAIMAHPIRKESAERIQERLGGDVPIVYDQNLKPSADKAQRWATGRRAWEAADPSADFHMVIQDDVLVAENVLPSLERALDELGPDGVVSAYTGTGRPDQLNVMKRLRVARKQGHSWIWTPMLYWGPAVIAPVYTIEEMLDWAEDYSMRNRPPRSNYDYAIGAFYHYEMRWRCWYTAPSLVDHAGLPSLVGHDSGPVRKAHNFLGEDGDALSVDWTRTPEGGLTPLL